MNSPEKKVNIEQYLALRLNWIEDAVELIGGDRSLDPTNVLILPEEVRDDSRALDLSAEQEVSLREIASRFGIGGEYDLPSKSDHQIMEGGKPWKIEAEARIADPTKSLIFAGQVMRQIGEDEISYLKDKFGNSNHMSEYQMSRFIAEIDANFEPLQEDEVLDFSYTVDKEHQILNKPSGQFVKIGENLGRSVIMLRVDGETYLDKDKKVGKRYFPSSGQLLGIIHKVLETSGDNTSSVGLITSTTYPSRAVDALISSMSYDRFFDVGMYGRHTLSEVRGQEASSPSPINQIPGELRVIYDKLAFLKEQPV